MGRVIADLCSDLERIIARRKQLATEIETAFMSHPLGKVLVTLCRFGPRTRARTLAEIGDPQRFANGGRLAAYAGLAPVDRRSGRSTNSSSQSRAEHHHLKNAMFLAAFVTAQHDPAAKAYYQRKRGEGKKHNAAVICPAHKRCDIILAKRKTATPNQQPTHENLPESRLTTRQGHAHVVDAIAIVSRWARVRIGLPSSRGLWGERLNRKLQADRYRAGKSQGRPPSILADV